MKIVIGLDDSPYSETVLEAVTTRHWPADTQFKIVSVVEPIPPEYRSIIEQEEGRTAEELELKRKERAIGLCEKARHRIESTIHDAIVFFEIRMGRPADELLDAATDWSADRILVGAHGHTACPRNLPGSVSRKIAAGAKCHVEIVRKAQSREPELSRAV